REFRILQDHAHATAAQRAPELWRRGLEIDTVEFHAVDTDPRVRWQHAEQGAASKALARAAFADDAELFAAQCQRHAAHGLVVAAFVVAEGDAEVVDLNQRAGQLRCLRCGSSRSRKASPRRLKPSETMKMAAPGMVATHHWSKMNLRPV